jgi:hypothetical protein
VGCSAKRVWISCKFLGRGTYQIYNVSVGLNVPWQGSSRLAQANTPTKSPFPLGSLPHLIPLIRCMVAAFPLCFTALLFRYLDRFQCIQGLGCRPSERQSDNFHPLQHTSSCVIHGHAADSCRQAGQLQLAHRVLISCKL